MSVPTFNHTRGDGFFDPCPECEAAMTPAQLEILRADRDAVRTERHAADFRRLLRQVTLARGYLRVHAALEASVLESHVVMGPCDEGCTFGKGLG